VKITGCARNVITQNDTMRYLHMGAATSSTEKNQQENFRNKGLFF